MSTVYVSGPYTSGKLLRDIRAIEDWISDELKYRGPVTDAAAQRDMARRVEEASFGRNAVLFDDQGYPSIMVRVPAMRLSDLVAGWPDDLHPAFVVNNSAKSEIWIGKYEATVAGSGTTLRAFSLRRRDPSQAITFDDALLACRQKGAGWHLMTNAEWAVLALWCKSNGFWPRGNNNFGRDYDRQSESGEVALRYGSEGARYAGRVATGSGPVSWSHDGTPFGVYDLNGNLWDWVSGLRLNNGEINILPNNNAADSAKDQGAASAEWQAIMPPGTSGTLKFDSEHPLTDDAVAQLRGAPVLRTALLHPAPATWGNNDYDYNSGPFAALTADAGLAVPNLLRYLAIWPVDLNHGGDGCWTRNYGERIAIRGGSWGVGGSAGVFALNLHISRTESHWSLGLRPAFVR